MTCFSIKTIIQVMQNKELIIVGIDVSKKTLDICVRINQEEKSVVIANSKSVIYRFMKQLQKEHTNAEIFIGLENTGIYNYPLYIALGSLAVKVFVLHPLDLSRSMGMLRGKNDKTDARRIAAYLWLHHTILSSSNLPSKTTMLLKALFAKRHKLVEQRAALRKSNKELELMIGKREAQAVIQSDKKVIHALNHAIKALESKIMEFACQDEQNAQHIQNIMSIQGVGPVLATYLTIKTNGFTQLTNARKLACYAGVVPFDYQSGTSLKKRPGVSMMADKELKRLLHLAALRVIQLKGELQDYFLRKVAEGKNKMSVINAIRNKIVARICSCINNKKKYQVNLLLS